METTNWIIAISGIATASFAAVQFHFNYKMEKQRRRDSLERELRKILDCTVQYPYLEHVSITEHWIENKGKMDERFMRYDQFCNMVFNYLESVYTFFDGDKKKIEDFVDVKNWVRLHSQNWQNPTIPYENSDSYSEGFRKFLDSYL